MMATPIANNDVEVSDDDLANLLAPPPPKASPHQVIPVPITIIDQDDKAFVIEEAGGSAYTELGIFGTGYFASAKAKQIDAMFPYRSIKRVEYTFTDDERQEVNE